MKSVKKITDFLVKLLGLIFVIGAATGIVMEFSFGTNWSDIPGRWEMFSVRYLPLKALLLFSGIGIHRSSSFRQRQGFPKVYWLAVLLVFVGGHLSAFWIVVANSWMQTPAGYAINEAGKIVLTSFTEAVF